MHQTILQITLRADYGGAPEHLWQLLRHKSGNDTYFIACPMDQPYWQRFHTKIPREHICPLPHLRFKITALLKLIIFICNNNIQLLHTHGKGARIYGKLAGFFTGVPCVHTPHGIHLGSYNRYKKFLYRCYENITGYGLKHIFYVSKSERQSAASNKLWGSIPFSIVSNGVNTVADEQRKTWRKQLRTLLGIAESDFVVASLTRFDYAKNMQEAYQIAKDFPNFIFLWIGDGEDKESLETQSRYEKVENIMFTGFTDFPVQFLAAADAYLSTSRWESLPFGVIKAMSVGLPVVASNVPGNRDAVKHDKTGFCYPLGETSAAGQYLTTIAEDKQLLDQLAAEALQTQRKFFSAQTMAGKIQEIYQEVIIN